MSGPQLRLRTLDGIAEDVLDVADFQDDLRFVIGTLAPQRDPAEIARDYDEDPEMMQWATEPVEPSTETIDGTGVARLVDYLYPGFAFDGDVRETNPVADAETQFAGTHLFLAEHVAEHHHQVLTPVEMHDRVQAVVDSYDEPEQWAALTGHFSPADGGFSICSAGAFHRLSNVAFPKAVAPEAGAMVLQKANMAFSGLVFVRREHLSPDALDVVRGETVEVSA